MSAADLQLSADPRTGRDFDVGEGSVEVTRPATTRLLTILVRSYQAARSGRPTGCRYLPTCSEYAVEAVDTLGPARGILMATRRIARCGPWGGHGVDPVPERRNP